MAVLEPTGMSTIEAGSDDAHEDYNNNMTLLNEAQVRFIQAEVGEAAGVDQWDVVYLSQADGKLYKALATSDLSQMPAVGVIAESKGNGDYARAIYQGIIADDSWELTPGTVLVLSSAMEGVYDVLENELERDISPFSIQQVLGFAISETEIYMDVQRPAIFAGIVVKEMAFEESTEDPVGYGDRGLLRIEDVDGTLELVYYDNGGQRVQLTSGGAVASSFPMKNEGAYAYESVERLIFIGGGLEEVEGEPGTYEYTPPLAGKGTEIGAICYFDGNEWVELAPGAEGEVLTAHGAGSAPTWE